MSKIVDTEKETNIFLGSEKKPFLAPRGVFFTGKHLLVSDTGQNRIFIWKGMPQGEYKSPDVILGHADEQSTGRNDGQSASAKTLHYPSGIWSDDKKVIVADAWNHRVLIWHKFPEKNGQAADVVLGQPDFDKVQPNVQGVNTQPSAQTLYWPYGVFSDGKSLWIADTGNRRVLFFEKIPMENFTKADKVIGQPTFSDRDYDSNNAIWPYSIKVSAKGELAITDTSYYRVLLWRHKEKAFQNPAAVILGQKYFDGNGQNQHSFFPQAHTLSWCYDTAFGETGIWVADTGNSRIVGWEELPEENNQAAKKLIGQEVFTSGSENMNSIQAAKESLYWPFSVCAHEGKLYMADTGNHRIVVRKETEY